VLAQSISFLTFASELKRGSTTSHIITVHPTNETSVGLRSDETSWALRHVQAYFLLLPFLSLT